MNSVQFLKVLNKFRFSVQEAQTISGVQFSEVQPIKKWAHKILPSSLNRLASSFV